MALSLLPNPNIALDGPARDALAAIPATKTYRVDWPEGFAPSGNATGGMVDGLTALKQAVFKHLQTWRGWYPIYNRQYGVELHDLPGMERGYIRAVARERIRDALSVDERILEVTDFKFEDAERDAMNVTFRVRTIYGDITQRMEVIR